MFYLTAPGAAGPTLLFHCGLFVLFNPELCFLFPLKLRWMDPALRIPHSAPKAQVFLGAVPFSILRGKS